MRHKLNRLTRIAALSLALMVGGTLGFILTTENIPEARADVHNCGARNFAGCDQVLQVPTCDPSVCGSNACKVCPAEFVHPDLGVCTLAGCVVTKSGTNCGYFCAWCGRKA